MLNRDFTREMNQWAWFYAQTKRRYCSCELFKVSALSITGNREDSVWDQDSGCGVERPDHFHACAHRRHTHTRRRRRHELQAPGVPGARPGIRRTALPPLHLQGSKPGLQGESVSRCLGQSLGKGRCIFIHLNIHS